MSSLAKPIRTFLPENLTIDSWQAILPFFEDIKNRNITCLAHLQKWLADWSELEAVLEEDLAWRYIKMNIDTTKKELAESFNFFITEIEPHIQPYINDFDTMLIGSPFSNELGEEYRVFLRGVKKRCELYREENIPLQTEIQTESQKYGTIAAAMSVEVDGEKLTMQRAAKLLEKQDRSLRETVFMKMNNRREQDETALDELFDKLVGLRHNVATNAGYDNFRDYKFDDLGRFDYTKEDCFDFHASIAEEIVPIVKQFQQERKEMLGYTHLRPWDTAVDPQGRKGLKPFNTGGELTNLAIECFKKVRPKFAGFLQTMQQMKYLDLESKEGKAPGGFNYPLYETGVPFIYMNAVGSTRDVVTMVHEGGHAVHSFLSRQLELTSFKSTPSEVAELASMSMELMSMEHWDIFYPNKTDLKRAKKEHLESVISILPWIATVDEFQHWIYENPQHTAAQRKQQWVAIMNRYSTEVVNWQGIESSREVSWQKQLHIFEVPFYYIEYGIAQLGAIAMWRNYKQNPEQALNKYEQALALGYTKTIPEIYEIAGLQFDFSVGKIKELATFVKSELAAL